MRYYPAFLKLEGEKVVFSGAGACAAAKIKLLQKTPAEIHVFGENPCKDVIDWAAQEKLIFHFRKLVSGDADDARLLYGANGDRTEDLRAVEIGKSAGALTNIVDDLEGSDFLTPAIVDRSPVTIAIGTEGTAPVLARQIKSQVEEMLPASTGVLARLGNAFRPVAAKLASLPLRRKFWSEYFSSAGPQALAHGGEKAVREELQTLYCRLNAETKPEALVSFVGAGPGDPELLTLKARKKLHEADVVLHDRLVTSEILELVRREAVVICVGKKGYGEGWSQEAINALIVKHAANGAHIVRLKSGDPSVFGRLDEELDVLDAENIAFEVVPGITSASAAAASIGTSLTRRGRNSSLRIFTAREAEGFGEQDWHSLAQKGATAAIYMGLRAATFLSGRLMMHGADGNAPVTIVENASRIDQRVITSNVKSLAADLAVAQLSGPAILFLGLTPRALQSHSLEEIAQKADQKIGTKG